MPWDDRDQKRKDKRVAETNATMDERHAGFDRAVQDNTMKYERPSFAVVGEGTKSAREKYEAGYAAIDWSR